MKRRLKMELIFHYGFIAGSLAWEYFLTRENEDMCITTRHFSKVLHPVLFHQSRDERNLTL